MDKQVHVHVGDTQAAKNDGPTEASDSLLIELPVHMGKSGSFGQSLTHLLVIHTTSHLCIL